MTSFNQFRSDIFNNPISVFLDKPDPTDPSTTPTDVSVFFSAKERSRLTIKTGTEAGHSEGSAYGSVTLRNLFGGAESLNCHGSFGTRTRSAYSAAYEMPLFSNPDFRWEVAGLASSTLKAWASHEEVLKGGVSKLKWGTPNGQLHEFSYNGFWRQVTGLSSNASPTVRADAGDSFKSSLKYMWVNDKRDVPLLPQRGYLLKSVAELAGFGPLKGDVSFGKIELESQAAVPVPMPASFNYDRVSFTVGLRAGILYPLQSTAESSSGGGYRTPSHSLINDRFQLGGPTDIRGFRLSGLGPRDGTDAVGGDVYAAGGASLLFPLPRVKRETPLRFQMFVNGGRLLALQDNGAAVKGKERFEDSVASDKTAAAVKRTVSSLADGWPSCSAGFGLVYAHPAARFEINFSLPLVLREGEEGRKGLSFGVGINFL